MVRRHIHLNPLVLLTALGVFIIILWFAFSLYADAATDVFPDNVLSTVDRSLDMSLLGQLPDHFKGKVVEIKGDVVSAEKDGKGVVVTIRTPASRVVGEVQDPDAYASPWLVPEATGVRRIVQPSSGVCRVRLGEPSSTELFQEDGMLRVIGTVRKVTPASVDEQGVAHSHLVDLSTSCIHIQPWDDKTGKLGEATTACEPMTK